MSSLSKHVIHRPKPFRTALLLLIVAIITYAAQWFIQQKNSDKIQLHIQELMATNQQLVDENKKSIAAEKQHFAQKLTLEYATTKQLQLQITKLQDQVLSLNKDLLFYQTITRGSGSSKLQIRELNLSTDANQADVVRYRIVITQGKKIKTAITGTVNIILNIDSNGVTQQHVLEPQKLNLRHVQVLEGQIKIADDTTPSSLKIDLIQKKKNHLVSQL